MSKFVSLQESLKTIADMLVSISEMSDMKKLLEDLLTPQEIEELAERIKLIRMLKEGKTQRDIAKKLGISVTTVNRGSRMLKYGSGGFRDVD